MKHQAGKDGVFTGLLPEADYKLLTDAESWRSSLSGNRLVRSDPDRSGNAR